MDCEDIIFSGHSIRRMFERGITRDDVLTVIKSGEIIAKYPDDTPFPSFLLLGVIDSRFLHVVVAKDDSYSKCIVITAYDPSADLWEDGFRERKK